MHRVRLENLQPGMRLARSVYGTDGRVLLQKGVFLKPAFIERLTDFGIPAVYIDVGGLEGVEIPDVIREEVRVTTIDCVRSTFDEFQSQKSLSLDRVCRAVNSLLDEILSHRGVLAGLTDIRGFDAYTYGHSVNVAVLSLMTGISLGLSQLELRELGIGAILHDLGKTLVPEDVISKTSSLTDEEWLLMQRHSIYGYRILAESHEISAPAAAVAYQHHERLNGTGYPRGLTGKEIHPYARIVTVADTYDAMTSDRVYRRGVVPYQAIKVLRALSGIQFDPDMVTAFLANVAVYPVGCSVRLSNGWSGVVTKVHKTSKETPVVRLLYSPQGDMVTGEFEVDLLENTEIVIEELIED